VKHTPCPESPESASRLPRWLARVRKHLRTALIACWGEDVDGVIHLKRVFEHGLQFKSSIELSGLQLVDAVAYTVRRAVLEPDDDSAQEAYDAIRAKLRNDDGRCLTIQRLSAGEEDRSSLDRYRPLYTPTA